MGAHSVPDRLFLQLVSDLRGTTVAPLNPVVCLEGVSDAMDPGSIVQCPNREWVLLPSDRDDLLLLRPLTGATDARTGQSSRLEDTQ